MYPRDLENKIEGYLAHGTTWTEFVGGRDTTEAAQELIDYIKEMGDKPPATAQTIAAFLDDHIA